jgi:hypothetical protein
MPGKRSAKARGVLASFVLREPSITSNSLPRVLTSSSRSFVRRAWPIAAGP